MASEAGACLNIKMSSDQYRYSHYKGETISLQSHLYNSYTWKDGLYIETGPGSREYAARASEDVYGWIVSLDCTEN